MTPEFKEIGPFTYQEFRDLSAKNETNSDVNITGFQNDKKYKDRIGKT